MMMALALAAPSKTKLHAYARGADPDGRIALLHFVHDDMVNDDEQPNQGHPTVE